MKHKLRGRMWEVERVARLPGGNRGLCDPPETVGKKIQILKRLKGEELIEVLFHEAIHACLWDIDEDAVAELAADAAKMIWKEMR